MEKANLTEAKINDRKNALAAALAPALAQAGVTGTFDLLNTQFTAACRPRLKFVEERADTVPTDSTA